MDVEATSDEVELKRPRKLREGMLEVELEAELDAAVTVRTGRLILLSWDRVAKAGV